VKYADVERERRWLLDGIPSAATGLTPTRIVDRYLDGLRMRLREMTLPDGTVVRKLGQKVRLGAGAREVACTNFYLSDEEWVRLSALPGRGLSKDRYAVPLGSLVFAVDVLHGEHEGVVLAEVDGGEVIPDPAPQLLEALGAVREVTDEEAFTGAALASPPAPGVAAEDLSTTLRVLDTVHELPEGHPDIEAVKRAADRMRKKVRTARRNAGRAEAKAPDLAHDRAVLDSTATGSPMRIDDETRGIPLSSNAPGAIAGELRNARGCYICHARYTTVDAFYHWLCPDCAATSHAKRDQRTDLTGRRALLTGGRAKIGMYIALRLLRDGADLTITTRFPHDAARRFADLSDSPEWLTRLTIVGIDLRDPTQVVALADEVAAAGPVDILINNACQTVRRSPGAYAHLVAAEREPLPAGIRLPEIVSFDRISEAHPAALVGSLREHPVAHHERTRQALTAGSASLEAYSTGTAVDAGGLLPDLQPTNSWTHTVDEVDPLELLEVQLCNQTAPFILVSRLRPAMRAAVARGARRAYVVNVSAMEGQFSRRYKGAGHPHTNMSKAALNMLTRTSSEELFRTDRILMTAVDTGWITDERPHEDKLRIAAEGWHAPLDLVDGAARVYDPIVRGEAGEDLFGVFLKDFEPHPW
jgi:NAD(P)-dependent dehydrogenase (short-subunit alcohol dehydrogenase family)/CYTH domain-containing protein